MIFSEVIPYLSEEQLSRLYTKHRSLFLIGDCHAMQKRLTALNIIEDEWFPLYIGHEQCPECQQEAFLMENHASTHYNLACRGQAGGQDGCGKLSTKWRMKDEAYYGMLFDFYYSNEDDAIEKDENP